MKNLTIILASICLLTALTACKTTEKKNMTVTSSGISDNVFKAVYGQFGHPANIDEKNPATDEAGNKVIMKVNGLSFPVTIAHAPAGTKAYALYLHDPDAAVHGFGDFVHWTAVFTAPELKEGASKAPSADMIQGVNGWGDTGYAGMGPPDKLGYTFVSGGPVFEGTHDYHTYILEVWALDSVPELKEGFSLDQLQAAIAGKTLASAQVQAKYFTDKTDF